MLERKALERIFGRIKLYFTTGHSLVLYIPWFVTQTTIWYYLLIQSIPALQAMFPHYYLFLILFITIYPFATVLLGYWYLRRSELFPSEAGTSVRQNPYFRDLAKAITFIAEGKNREAVKLLEKWTKR